MDILGAREQPMRFTERLRVRFYGADFAVDRLDATAGIRHGDPAKLARE